jgi:hypothetical protein
MSWQIVSLQVELGSGSFTSRFFSRAFAAGKIDVGIEMTTSRCTIVFY